MIKRVLIVCGCLAFSLSAQTLEFDAASIKPNPDLPIKTIGPWVEKGKVTGTAVTLLDLLMAAYDVSAPRILGPGWLTGSASDRRSVDRFDVIARSASESSSKEELRGMLQTLLKQRFHLVAHEETREMPAYDLVIAKGGSKLMKYDADVPTPPTKKYPGASNLASAGGTLTIDQLAVFLSRAAARPVLDKTGLEGKYTFSLTYRQGLPTTDDSGPDGPPDLFAAVQQELGLKLEPSKAPMTVIVVEQAERTPTEN